MKRTAEVYDIFKPKRQSRSPAATPVVGELPGPSRSQSLPSIPPQPHCSTDVSSPPPSGIASAPELAAENPLPLRLDIGHARGNTDLTDRERLTILDAQWVAPDGFQWPFTERKDGTSIRRKYLGQQHFSGVLDCFSYSIAKQGIYCRPCTLFAPSVVGGVQLSRLVKTPLQKYTHLTGRDGYLTNHLSTAFHEDSVKSARAFRDTLTGTGNIEDQINTASRAQRQRNRAALKRIIAAIEYHGRLGLSLRGHKDHGVLNLPSGPSSSSSACDIDYSQRNFRSLLQLMVMRKDDVLSEHFRTAGKNATYISSTAQNSLIRCIGTVLQRAVVQELQQARFFSIIADETTDSGQQEQLTVCVRYVFTDLTLRERFLCFQEAPELTGGALAKQLLTIIGDCGIDMNYMVGQAYDGAAAMSGKQNGVQAHIISQYPHAAYVHCASHALNLCLVKAAEVPDIRAVVAVMQSIAVFYSDSNKRLLDLQSCIADRCPQSSHTRLKQHCATRWVEKQDAVLVFDELYPAIRASLDRICLWPGDAGGKALSYQGCLNGGFLVALKVIKAVLQVTRPLSAILQSVDLDINRAVKSVEECQEVLQTFRDDENIFSSIYSAAVASHGEEIPMPRVTSRQRYRANVPADNAADYYRLSVFLPFIDTCSAQLRQRFQMHSSRANQLSSVLPSVCCNARYSHVGDAVEMYSCLLPDGSSGVEAEFMRWQSYWKKQPANTRPSQAVEALSACADLQTYPSIVTLLRIFATLPVATASGERSFSALKYIKNYLRSTMKEVRLNALAHLYLNKDIKLNSDDVVDEFGKTSHRLAFT